MRSTLLRPTLAGSLFLACLASVSSVTSAAAQDQSTVPADRHDDDNGFDKGWLGLIGLAGLLGLKRRDETTCRSATRPETTPAGAPPPESEPDPGPVPDTGVRAASSTIFLWG